MAVRLVFAYESGELRLVARQPVDMVVPPSDPLTAPAPGAGVWAEVRDTEGRTLHRRSLPDVLRPDVEVFGPDPGQSVTRAPVERPSNAFAVVVPDIEEADHLALMAAPDLTGPAVTAEPRQLLRVALSPS